MTWLVELFTQDSVAHTLLVISLVICSGMVVGEIPLFKIKLGIAGVLFSGLAFGHYGITIDTHTMHFIREFGLILFVYAIGLQVGPNFIESFKQNGITLNIMAASIVILGAVIAVLISYFGGIEIPVAVGLFSGATTNTPSLAAAQEILSGIESIDSETLKHPGLGYAVAYPFGIIGIILTMLLTKLFFKVDIKKEERCFLGEQKVNEKHKKVSEDKNDPQIIPIFIGITLGVILGSWPFFIPGIPSAIKLGLAGGPLIVAIILSRIGTIGPLSWRLPKNSNIILKDIGIVLFLGCVGLHSGDQFINTLVNGDGFYWMACAVMITLIPLVLVSFIAKGIYKLNFLSICGLLAGSMTDPPALAFANSFSSSSAVSTAYATVYPLVMILRIISAQLIILLFI